MTQCFHTPLLSFLYYLLHRVALILASNLVKQTRPYRDNEVAHSLTLITHQAAQLCKFLASSCSNFPVTLS